MLLIKFSRCAVATYSHTIAELKCRNSQHRHSSQRITISYSLRMSEQPLAERNSHLFLYYLLLLNVDNKNNNKYKVTTIRHSYSFV